MGAGVAAVGLTYFAVAEPLALLRWVGTLGLLLTATRKVLSYDSPQARLLLLHVPCRMHAWPAGMCVPCQSPPQHRHAHACRGESAAGWLLF